MTHRGATEVERLAFEVVLLDANQAPLGRLPVLAHPDFEPPLRDGDSNTFYVSLDVPLGTHSVLLESGTRSEVPGATRYGDVGEYEVTFDPPAGSHFEVGVTKRTYRSRPLGDHTQTDAIVAIENRGETVIRALELELRAFDANGAQIDDHRETVAYSHMLPMAPGERRVAKLDLWAPGTIAREVLVVTRIE